jgi:hypothetical protein
MGHHEFRIKLRPYGLEHHELPPVEVPYTRDLGNGYGWVDGDRRGYRDAWTFLQHLDSGLLVGRAYFQSVHDYEEKPPEQYGEIMDEGMLEGGKGGRNWDGTMIPEGVSQSQSDTGIKSEYEHPETPFTEQTFKPRVRYWDVELDEMIEERNYNALPNPTGFIIEGRSKTPDRVTILFHFGGYPVIAIYYDRLDPSVEMKARLR